jgi:glycosyltransferase involved in cell wall biosynthesis
VRERYQLQHGFILYAGNIKPHKNLVRLIEAFSEIRQGPFQELKLLIIGDQISKLPALRRACTS